MSAWIRMKFVLAGISKIKFGQPFLVLSFYNNWLKNLVQETMYISIVQGGKTILAPVKFTELISDWMKDGLCIWLDLPDLPEDQKFEVRFLLNGKRNCISLPIIT
jgi:hypothetical protein